MTYKEQEKEALRLIRKFGPLWMMNDFEAIGEVIGTAITARIKHDPNKSRLSSYLVKSVRNKIYKLVDKKYRTMFTSDDIVIQARSTNNDILDFVFTNHLLTSREKHVLYRYYYCKEKMQDVADDLGITRQRIEQHLSNAISKLRKVKHALVEK